MTKITYIVKAGDTLPAIATRYGTNYQKIIQDNNVANPTLIHPDDLLTIDLPNPLFPWSPPVTALEIFSPVANTLYHSPMEIIGYVKGSESGFKMRLISTDEVGLGERSMTDGQSDEFRFFCTYIRFTVNEPTTALLEIYEEVDGEHEATLAKIPLTLLPGQRLIDMDGPEVGEEVFGEVKVMGYSQTFEGDVDIRFDRRNGSQMGTEVAIGGGTEYAPFIKKIRIAVENPTPLLIGTRELSAQDGSPIDWTRIPICVYPPHR